jgi:hypothetical protein
MVFVPSLVVSNSFCCLVSGPLLGPLLDLLDSGLNWAWLYVAFVRLCAIPCLVLSCFLVG